MPDQILQDSSLSVADYFDAIAKIERVSIAKFPSLIVRLTRKEQSRNLQAFVVQGEDVGDNLLACMRLKLIKNAQARVHKLLDKSADKIEFDVQAAPDLVRKKREKKAKDTTTPFD